MKSQLLMVYLMVIMISGTSFGQLLDQPESIAFDTLHNQYLVSNIGDGKVIAIDSNGVQSEFLTGFNRCYGNCIKDDIFYVSNGHTVFGIGLVTTDTVFQVQISPQNAVDGLAPDTSGFLYGVDTGGRIIKYDLAFQSASVFVNSDLAAFTQDIFFDKKNNRLLAIGYSTHAPLQAINLDDSTVETVVTTPYSNYDGITMDIYGNTYLASHAGGQIIMYDSTYTNPPTIASTGHVEPTGLDYNARDFILAVPNFGADRVDFVNIFLGFDTDTTWGWTPFKVEFTGVSPLTVDEWSWDFGDGETATGQTPIHIYEDRGIYDISLEILAGDDTISYAKDNHIVVLADSIIAGDVQGEPGESIEVALYASTTVPHNRLRIPVEYSGLLNLTLDSFSTAGCRTEHFDNVDKISSDVVNRKASFRISNDLSGTTPDMEPGEGPVLKLYFTISSAATFGQTTSIVLDGYSTQILRFDGPMVDYTPIDISGTVSLPGICGDVDDNGLVNILDITYLISYLYKGGPEPSNPGVVDVNKDTLINILDITYLISYLYKSGPEPNC